MICVLADELSRRLDPVHYDGFVLPFVPSFWRFDLGFVQGEQLIVGFAYGSGAASADGRDDPAPYKTTFNMAGLLRDGLKLCNVNRKENPCKLCAQFAGG